MNPENADPIEIHRAEVGDAAAISELILGLAHSFTLRPDGAGAEVFLSTVQPAAIAGYIAAQNFMYFKAESDGKLAGIAAIRDTTHLYHLFVAPEFQKRGLARVLWEHASAAARAAGNAGGFTVFSTPSAVPVYERFGFRATGTRIEKDGIAFVPMRTEAKRESES